MQLAGTLSAPGLLEASGLAASARRAGLFWAVNDSGNTPVLYALDEHGGGLGAVTVAGARNRDWEDVAAFALDGKPHLLIADTGDNLAHHRSARLYVVEEPPPASARVELAWTVNFTWPDGPRDCEAVAVDPAGGRVLLLSKRELPPRVYAVPLRPAADGEVVRAELLTTLGWLANPAARARRMPWALLPDQPTAWDITPQWIAILTYGRVVIYRRAAGEPVIDALARAPESLELAAGFQAEALTLAGDASVYVTGEGERAALLAAACACDGCRVP